MSAPPARHVIVHFHMFKNGGRTIEAILQREFRARYATAHGSHVSSALDAVDIAAFLDAHPNAAALSSHHLRYPLPSMRRTVLFDWCFLRHPLDRLHSVYTYLRREPPELGREDPILVLSQSLGPQEFAMHMIDEWPHFVCNAQTLLIATGGAFTRPLDETDLSRAKERLRQMAVPGLVGMFDESLVAAEHFLGPAFPRVRLHNVAQNVTRPSIRNFNDRLEELRAIWGFDVYDELLRLNHLDLELCEYAENEIGRRFRLVPNSEERLLEFRGRCARLRLQAASYLAFMPLNSHRGLVIWLTGLSGAGKSTIAEAAAEEIRRKDVPVEVLDGDTIREKFSRGLGFSKQDRDENVRRAGFVAKLLASHGVVVLVALVSPYRATREEVREDVERAGIPFVEVFANAPLDVCEGRDPKGLYQKARRGEISSFTGLDDPYEAPLSPDVECRTDRESVTASTLRVLDAVPQALAAAVR